MKKLTVAILTTIAMIIHGNSLWANGGSYSINLNTEDKVIKKGHLNLGGSNPNGESIAFNSFYMEVDGKPFIPIMGEIHFSRVPHQTWEEQILKMKAGGINVIATYVFWALHEPIEGVSDWSGDRDLRGFLELCKKHNMKTIVRIGPFCHGEMRNGSIPDWLYGRPFQIRTNDPEYLKYVDKHWTNIARQLEGTYYKDGGIVIGIQLENELQHSASPWAYSYPGQPLEFTVADYDVDNTKIGVSVQESKIVGADSGEKHMRTLKDLAISKGMITPLYTATGWGNSAVLTNEVIPVTSTYPYNWWDEKVIVSPFYLFRDIHKTPDYSPVRYIAEDYPSFNAEMGVGVQMIYSRREIVSPEASEALMLRSLGSSANGIGYYMYHGGTTPRSQSGFYSDEPMGVPKMSYDFQAPIGEFGDTRASYHALRLIHNFTTDFGDIFAPMGLVLPEGYDKIAPEDNNTLRYAVRKRGNSGFVFMTNFQDHAKRHDLNGLDITLKLADESLRIPAQGTMTLKANVSAILPFNLDMDGILLKTSTAQLLANIEDNGISHYFFFTQEGLLPEFVFDTTTMSGGKKILRPQAGKMSTVKLKSVNGKTVLLTTLTKAEALDAYKIETPKGQKLVLTKADLMQNGTLTRLQDTAADIKLAVFPSKKGDKKYYSEITLNNKPVTVEPIVYKASDRRFMVNLPSGAFEGVSDLLLEVDFTGDTGAAFIDGYMVTDHFYYGKPWTLGLKRFASELNKNKGIYFYLRPIYKNAPYLNDLPEDISLDFTNGDICRLNGIRIIPEYYAEINLF